MNQKASNAKGARVAVRKAIAAVTHWSGLLRLSEGIARSHTFRRSPGADGRKLGRAKLPRFAILCYHRVGVGGVPIYSEMPGTLFRTQMRFLRKHYRVISLSALLNELASPRNTEPAVAVTFDDGYSDVYREALPALVEYRIPATIYLTVGCIESGEVAWYDRIFLAMQLVPGKVFNFMLDSPRRFSLSTRTERLNAAVEIITWMRTLPDSVRQASCAALERSVARLPKSQLESRMLNWEQVREMQDAGIAFGCHTMTHPVVSCLDSDGLTRELIDSKRILEERLQAPVCDFAYPFGKAQDMSRAADAVLLHGGYRSAVSTAAGLNVPGVDMYRLRRISVGQEHSAAMLGFQLNRLFLQGEYEPPMRIASKPAHGPVRGEKGGAPRLPVQGN